jgi:hypothetical protein
VTNGEIAVALVGDHCDVADPVEFSRRIRRRITTDGLNADIAADVNVAISTGGGTASVRQHAPIRQGRRASAGADTPDPKEQP